MPKVHKLWKAMVAATLALLVPACGSGGTSDVGAGANWLSHGGGADESDFSRLDQITSENVGQLGLDWYLDLDGEVALEATPLAVDGVLYFTGTYSAVYAVDAKTGEVLWKHDPETWRHPTKVKTAFPVNRGCAYADGKIFSATLDGRLIALDAKTGELLWSVQTLDPEDRHTITGAPRTFNGKVIIGNGGADYGARGFVTAYDQATGKQLWRFYTVPGTPEENRGDPAMEKAAATWSGEYWKIGTGGTVWHGMTFDPEFNRIYIGTGNSGPYDPELRSPGGGDNLYLASIVALDADTGKYIWHYQVNPREAWDYKATPNIIAATLEIDGKPRKVLMQAPTNGFFYVLDRETGKLISAEKIGKVTWADSIDLETGRPVERPGIRYEQGETTIFPSPLGAHNWQDMAFSPQTGLVYIPYQQLGVRFSKNPGPGEISFAGLAQSVVKEDPEDGKGALLAWDPVQQKVRWKVQHDWLWNGGALATAGDLVFQGGADGHFSAYDAASGKRLWRFNAGLGIIANPISYQVDGEQYISVLVGFGGNTWGEGILNAGWKYGAQPRRLLTFKLDGKETLPPSPPADVCVRAKDDPAYRIKRADLAAGRETYTWNCALCHGVKTQSFGAPAPDLRESAIALSPDDLWNVVHEGLLVKRGMPRFENLSRQQVDSIYNYIRFRARTALEEAAKAGANGCAVDPMPGGASFGRSGL